MSVDVKPRQLIPKDELRRLGQRSDRRGFVQLSKHLALIVGLAWLSDAMSDSAFYLVFVFLYGVALVFLFAALHESIHNTAFHSRRINETVAALCGFVLLIPARYFRLFHFAHHRYTQVTSRDPELQVDKPANRWDFWWQMSGLPLWWSLIRTLLRCALGQVNETFVRGEDKAVVMVEARIHLALYAILVLLSLQSASDFLLWFWVIPLLLAQPMLRLYLLAEHHGCDFGDDMLCNSRTTHSSTLVRFLAWNMPFHAEHHYLPSIPFFQLPSLHGYLKNHIKFQQPGYLAFIGSVYRDLARG